MKKSLFLFTVIFLLAACNSSRQFTSRRYTKGRYVSHTAHKQRVESEMAKVKDVAAINKYNGVSESMTIKPEQRSLKEASGEAISHEKKQEDSHRVKQRALCIEDNTLIASFHKKFENKKEANSKHKSAEGKPGNKSLASVIFSGTGMVLDVVGLVVALVTLEYFFIAFLLAGFILGILGLIFGIRGIKEYKREKMNGNKNKSILILGIIGTAVGGAAIFAALYFLAFGAFFISFAG